jgi:hypothetical protein
MAEDDTHRDMTKRARAVHGPRPIASIVPAIARAGFNRTAPGVTQLVEAWVTIVGPALADATAPRRLQQGTLTIGCSGPVAMELQHLSGELISRINQYLGSQVVRHLRFVQTLAVPAQPRVTPPRSKAAETEAVEAVAHLPDGPLRDALAALGSAVLSESSSRLGKQPRTRY